MYTKDLLKILEDEVAPVALSDELCKTYDMYDNSGVIIDTGKPVVGVVFSLDLSRKSIEFAIKNGANCIVTHHPAIYGGIHKIDCTTSTQAQNLALCVKNDISVISMHLNFDAAEEGIDYYLMQAVGGKQCVIMDKISVGGYGRVYGVKKTFASLCTKLKAQLKTNKMLTYGDGNQIVTKVASFCGAGGDGKAVQFAVKEGANVFISADMAHHVIAELVERNICVVNLTHYSSENYGLEQIANKIIKILSVPAFTFVDEELL